MRWDIEFEPRALRQLKKLGNHVAGQITKVLEERIASQDNPRVLGRAMEGKWKGLWRFRIGDYRVICDIRDTELVIVAVSVGHRKEVCD